jgi:hypothetical protein
METMTTELPDELLEERPEFARALDAVAKATQATTVFNFLEDYLVGRQHQLDRDLFRLLEGPPSPEAIVALCHQKNEVHRFLRNLEVLIKAGQGAARVLQPMMDHQI